jgi:hypothetical protein
MRAQGGLPDRSRLLPSQPARLFARGPCRDGLIGLGFMAGREAGARTFSSFSLR